MTSNPLDELDELEARQRHPAGQARTFCPQTGRALPQRIPARPAPPLSRGECLLMAVMAGVGCAIFVWLIGTVFSGGAL